jgi:hypothetical protein
MDVNAWRISPPRWLDDRRGIASAQHKTGRREPLTVF